MASEKTPRGRTSGGPHTHGPRPRGMNNNVFLERMRRTFHPWTNTQKATPSLMRGDRPTYWVFGPKFRR